MNAIQLVTSNFSGIHFRKTKLSEFRVKVAAEYSRLREIFRIGWRDCRFERSAGRILEPQEVGVIESGVFPHHRQMAILEVIASEIDHG